MAELNTALRNFDADPSIGTMVLTGSERAFAGIVTAPAQRRILIAATAGADIKEMRPKTYMDAYKEDMLSSWADIVRIRKPILAAVNGFAVLFIDWQTERLLC